MRAILIDWLVEVHLKFNLIPETLYLAVNVLDRYLEFETIQRSKLQVRTLTLTLTLTLALTRTLTLTLTLTLTVVGTSSSGPSRSTCRGDACGARGRHVCGTCVDMARVWHVFGSWVARVRHVCITWVARV